MSVSQTIRDAVLSAISEATPLIREKVISAQVKPEIESRAQRALIRRSKRNTGRDALLSEDVSFV